MNAKSRRHSGRVTPRIIFDGMPKEVVIDNCLEPRAYWDDWSDYRDGFRSCDDRKQLRKPYFLFANSLRVAKWNKKLKSLIMRRKAKQKSLRNAKVYKL